MIIGSDIELEIGSVEIASEYIDNIGVIRYNVRALIIREATLEEYLKDSKTNIIPDFINYYYEVEIQLPNPRVN